METIIRIKPSELTIDILNNIKALFKNEGEIEISISPVSDFGLQKKESQKMYINRLNKAIENLESNKNTISLSEDEFEALSNDLMKNK